MPDRAAGNDNRAAVTYDLLAPPAMNAVEFKQVRRRRRVARNTRRPMRPIPLMPTRTVIRSRSCPLQPQENDHTESHRFMTIVLREQMYSHQFKVRQDVDQDRRKLIRINE